MLNPTTKIGTIGSAGRFIPGIVARVVKEDGSLAMEGEQGELVVRGPSMALRYHGNEKACVQFCSVRVCNLYSSFYLAHKKLSLMAGSEPVTKLSCETETFL